MDATVLVRTLFEAVPAHRTFGLTVRDAVDGCAVVELRTRPSMTNVIGSLHSSGLVALIDAAGLAAIISSATAPEQLDGFVPLGRAASLTFRAPARGLLTARCTLAGPTRTNLVPLFVGDTAKLRTATTTEITDGGGTVVCLGTFDWSLRRGSLVGR